MVYKALHITLASLLWLSSTGFVLNKHYCQDILRDMSVFVQAENCHDRMARKHGDMPKSCPMHKTKAADKHEKDCCDDTAEYLHLDEDLLKAESTNLSFDGPLPVVFSWYATGLAAYDIDHSHPEFLHYKPPPLVCDLSVALQTFRL